MSTFDPEHNSLALDPNAKKNYAMPFVEVWGPNGEYEPRMRWDNARDLLRFGTVNQETGERQKWTRYDPKLKPAPRTVEDDVKDKAAAVVNAANEKKVEQNGKLEGLRLACKLMQIAYEPTWGIKRLETALKNAATAAASGLKAPDEGLPTDEVPLPDAEGDGTMLQPPPEGLE